MSKPEAIDVDVVRYVPSPTCRLFHGSDAFVRGIMGPVGSGKSSACVNDLFDIAVNQAPYRGVRKTRFGIIRNTGPQLISTTMTTWKRWVPTTICPISMASPIMGDTKRAFPKGIPLADGTFVDIEVYFIAMDQEEDIRKLKSLDLTMVWINEASEVDKAVLEMATSRVDRYPPKDLGGCTRSGIILDTNPPDVDSWWYNLAEVVKPDGYHFFKQPPALIPLPRKSKDHPQEYTPNTGQFGPPPAENIDKLNSGYEYYMRLIPGKSEGYIKVFVLGQYGTSSDGKPIYPEYRDDVHCATAPLQVMRGLPLIIGWDFGRTPTCVFMQLTPRGQLRIIDELCGKDIGVRQFVQTIAKPHIMRKYSGMDIRSVGDPAGASSSQESNEITCMRILAEEGIPTEMARTNKFIPRREAVAYFLNRMADGQPGLLLSPTCTITRQGFSGKYRYRKMRLNTGIVYANDAEDNDYTHCADCIHYGAMLAQGESSNGSGGFDESQNQTYGSMQARPVDQIDESYFV